MILIFFTCLLHLFQMNIHISQTNACPQDLSIVIQSCLNVNRVRVLCKNSALLNK